MKTETTKEQEGPVLMYFNERDYNGEIARKSVPLQYINAAIAALKEHGILFSELQEVEALISAEDPIHFLKVKQAKKAEVKLGNLVLDFDQLASLVKLPEMPVAISALKALKQWRHFNSSFDWEMSRYALTKEGLLGLSEEFLASTRMGFTTFTASEKQTKLYNRLLAIAEEYNDIIKEYEIPVWYAQMDRMILRDQIKGNYRPNPQMVLQF